MTNTAKTQFVLLDNSISEDDDAADTEGQYLFALKKFLPDTDMRAFQDFDDALDYMKTVRPQIVVLDCHNYEHGEMWATYNVQRILEDLDPESWPETIIIQSSDTTCIRYNAKGAEAELRYKAHDGHDISRIKILAVHRDEFSLTERILDNENISMDYLRHVESETLRSFLNARYNLQLPVTVQDLAKWITVQQYQNELPRASEAIKLHESDALTTKKMLAAIKSDLQSAWQHDLDPHVTYPDNFDFGMTLHFKRSSGQPVVGPAAFHLDDVKRLSATAEKPVYFMNEYQPDHLDALLGKIGGVVMLETNMPAHMATLFGAHRIAGLYGATTAYERIDNPDHTVSLISRAGTISTGDMITLNPEINTMSPGACAIGKTYAILHKWMHDAHDLLDVLLQDQGVTCPAFKITIDSLTQAYDSQDYNFGLVRTEHLLVENPDGMKAFQNLVRAPDDATLKAFTGAQTVIFNNLYTGRDHRMTRVRLVDAPLNEFFNPEDQAAITEKYGHARGAQLAMHIPGLYESQMQALCTVYAGTVAEYREWQDESFAPLEIMLPTIRTEEEVTIFKAAFVKIAAAFDIPPQHYRFGVMMETVEAGQNIESIVRHCDFISIGSNDYTSESLSCDRDDWGKRHQLTLDNGNRDPFITLHNKVARELTDIITRARKAKPNLQIDLCGDHGVDLPSLIKLQRLALNNISVPPGFKNMVALPLMLALQIYETSPKTMLIATPAAPQPS